MNTIDNRSLCISPNFKGKLTKHGVKLAENKFNEVANLYEKMSADLPDLLLKGSKTQRDNGQFIHFVDVEVPSENLLDIFFAINADFKEFFQKKSPKEIAENFVNIAKRYAYVLKKSVLLAPTAKKEIEIQKLSVKIDAIKAKANIIRENGNEKMANMWSLIAKNMEGKLSKLEKELKQENAKFCKDDEHLRSYLSGEIDACFQS